MRNIIKSLCVILFPVTCVAQETMPTVNIDAQAKVGYYDDRVGSEKLHNSSGFKGDYLNLIINGRINNQFSYSWRQRLNKKIENNGFFDATDWMYICYQANKNWNIAGGKQIVLIGGYEYDRAPIDVYTYSEYCNNIGCYQFGVSATYITDSGKDKFSVQFSESPVRYDGKRDLYAYNVFWNGSHGLWHSLYSVNLIQYASGKYISYIALGNKITMGNVSLELDVMNRAARKQAYLFRDCSVMANVDYRVLPKLNVYGKVTYDVNKTKTEADYCVKSGTELRTISGGLEFFPIRNKNDIRLNIGVAHTHGKNSNPDGTLLNDRLTAQIGVTAKLHLLSYGK